MFVKRFFEPKLAQTSYLIGCAEAREAIVIDPNRDVDQYLRGGARPKACGSRTSPRRTSTPTSCPAAASWRRARARRSISPTKAIADWKYAFAGDPDVDADQARRSHRRRQRPDRRRAHAGPHARAPDVSRHRSRAARASRSPRRPATSSSSATSAGPICSSAPRTSRGRWRRARGRCTGACRRSRTRPDWLQIWPGHGAGIGVRQGHQRHSAEHARLRAALQLGVPGRRAKHEFVESVLAGQPEPPKYFAEMKRVNKEGPRSLGGFPTPEHLDAGMLPSAPRRGRARDRHAARRRSIATGHVPGTINIPLNSSFTTWAGWLVPSRRTST